ncbi:MAG: DeoR/GlpR transcriptional regulator [Lachnospiraceae bacterium]|nr:DeoR/GlpR transcriptional regulator [Lachnospiraceae bacterium]
MKSFRLRRMEQYILEKEHVSMEELCREFDMSINTVRLDVAQLVSKGSIKKIYGGVCSNHQNSLVPFEERKMKNEDKKRAICYKAAGLVEDGDIIFIDSGTTAMYLVDFLEERKNVTVLTNNLNVIIHAVPYPNLQIICLPGILERKTNSFVSAETGKILSRYNIRKAFFAATGVTENGDVTNSSSLEYEVKRAALSGSEQKYLLLDSSKFGKSALLTFAEIADMNRVITDYDMNPALLELCIRNNVAVDMTEPPEQGL